MAPGDDAEAAWGEAIAEPGGVRDRCCGRWRPWPRPGVVTPTRAEATEAMVPEPPPLGETRLAGSQAGVGSIAADRARAVDVLSLHARGSVAPRGAKPPRRLFSRARSRAAAQPLLLNGPIRSPCRAPIADALEFPRWLRDASRALRAGLEHSGGSVPLNAECEADMRRMQMNRLVAPASQG